jgi:hypothetical protein
MAGEEVLEDHRGRRNRKHHESQRRPNGRRAVLADGVRDHRDAAEEHHADQAKHEHAAGQFEPSRLPSSGLGRERLRPTQAMTAVITTPHKAQRTVGVNHS